MGARATCAQTFDNANSPAEFRDADNVFDLYAVSEPDDGRLKGLRVDLGVDNVTDEDHQFVHVHVSKEARSFNAGIAYRISLCGIGSC
ncbi:MAG: hypothetical protein AAFZ01_11400 [Pseudomonadota bacterium]